MSLYVLDTDTLTLHWHQHSRVMQQVAAHASDDIVTTVISVEEQLTGWYNSIRRARKPPDVAKAYRNLAAAVDYLAGWVKLQFTETAVARYQQLASLVSTVGRTDLKIAAIVLENGGTLVTRNRRDFQRIPGLTVEDWSV